MFSLPKGNTVQSEENSVAASPERVKDQPEPASATRHTVVLKAPGA